MIIYGTNSAKVKTVQSESATCPNCQVQGKIDLSVHRKHAHIYWIPLFPLNKIGIAECKHCGYAMDEAGMPEDLRQSYRVFKDQVSGPIWQFIGLVGIIILGIVIFISVRNDSAAEREYLDNPQVGDVYEYELAPASYTTLKVSEVEGDSIYVYLNDWEVNKKSGVDDIDKPENYSEDSVYVFGKQELIQLYDENVIFDVNRD